MCDAPYDQVKAFRFMGCAPRRPFRLTARAKDNARSRLRGENPCAGATARKPTSPTLGGRNPAAKGSDSFCGRSGKGGTAGGRTRGIESDSDGGGGDRGVRRVRRSNRDGFGISALKEQPHGANLRLGSDVFGEEGLGLGGDWEAAAEAAVAAAASGEGGSGGGTNSERKKLACGMCGAMRTPEDVSFRMTAKMVRETMFHVSVWTVEIGLSVIRSDFDDNSRAGKTKLSRRSPGKPAPQDRRRGL